MSISQDRIEQIGHQILHGGKRGIISKLAPKNWGQHIINKMMEQEDFRTSALHFTDVAPTLEEDHLFMDHLQAYFKHGEGVAKFIGSTLPSGGFLDKVIAPLGRRNIKSIASGFIAGESIEEVLKQFEKFHRQGVACSIDILGEAVLTQSESTYFINAYKKAIVDISTACQRWPYGHYPEEDAIGTIARANVSVKLSALYEHTNANNHNDSVEQLTERFSKLLRLAQENTCFINIDMEQFELIPLTLEVFESVICSEEFKDYPHVGIVCQAYLRESDGILNHLIHIAKKRETPFSIRLVKGAYWDYEQAHAQQQNWPCPVFDNKAETDENYEALTRKIIRAFPTVRPCIASHNARSLAVAIYEQEEAGLSKLDVEFQMLFGMAENFKHALVDMGYRVRQYCPTGEFIPGMSYLVRRLLENTANQSFLRMHEEDLDESILLAAPQVSVPPKLNTENFSNAPLQDFAIYNNRQSAQKAIAYIRTYLPYTIEGSMRSKASTKRISQPCPWNTTLEVTNVGCCGVKDADFAIKTAHKAFQNWRHRSAEDRAEILKAAAHICKRDWNELFGLQVLEAGKDWVSADADICEGIDFMNFYSESAITNKISQPLSLWGEENKAILEPRGVCAVIAPWNFPFAISAGMVCAALVSGNTVVYKPSEQTSAIGRKLYDILIEAGVPEDVLHFIPGKGEEVGQKIVEHPLTSTIAFTGSREVGLHIMQEAAKVHKDQKHVKKCIIEMGGKNAIIVDSDADLDEAIPAVVHSAFAFQGQKCSACSRVIVIGSAYERFIKRLSEVVENMKVGPASDPQNHVNALVDEEAYKKVQSYIRIGKKDGKLLTQASCYLKEGYFIPPTVFTDLKKNSRLTTEEVFGPVLAVYKAKSVEDAVEMAMENEYRLTGAFFSRHPEHIDYVKEHFKVGNLYINRGSTGALVGRQPFGGGGLSGTGSKTGSIEYLSHFMEPRAITENTMRRGFAPQTS